MQKGSINLNLGAFFLRHHNSKRAARIFTECLETSKFYDPEIR